MRQFNFNDKLGLTHNKPKLYGNVIVVGGGNVDMDGARCAVRSGANRTVILYRRDRSEPPYTPLEMEDAKKDGIKFNLLKINEYY